MVEEPHACPLCHAEVTRKKKVPDRSADVFDCPDCGRFEMGRGTQMSLAQSNRDESDIRARRPHIKAANERGFLFRYPGGEQVRHEWVKHPDDTGS
jgi:predicted RNA-binding Zn-ribbon protein involved in translation (DUF1610 family)